MKEFQLTKKPYVEEILRIVLHGKEVFNIPKAMLVTYMVEQVATLEGIPVHVLTDSKVPSKINDLDAFYGVTFSNGSTYYKINYTSAFGIEYEKGRNTVCFSVVRVLPLEFEEISSKMPAKASSKSKKSKK